MTTAVHIPDAAGLMGPDRRQELTHSQPSWSTRCRTRSSGKRQQTPPAQAGDEARGGFSDLRRVKLDRPSSEILDELREERL
jgi:hypothetical protein